MRNNLFQYLILAPLFLAGMGSNLVAVPNFLPQTEDRISASVHCGSQGILDKDWFIEFDVHDPSGAKLNNDPV